MCREVSIVKIFTFLTSFTFYTHSNQVLSLFLILTQGHFFIAFIDRRRKREKHQCKGESLSGCFLYVSRPGITHTQTGGQTHKLGIAITENSTWNLSCMGWCFSQLSHTGQGQIKYSYLLLYMPDSIWVSIIYNCVNWYIVIKWSRTSKALKTQTLFLKINNLWVLQQQMTSFTQLFIYVYISVQRFYK